MQLCHVLSRSTAYVCGYRGCVETAVFDLEFDLRKKFKVSKSGLSLVLPKASSMVLSKWLYLDICSSI